MSGVDSRPIEDLASKPARHKPRAILGPGLITPVMIAFEEMDRVVKLDPGPERHESPGCWSTRRRGTRASRPGRRTLMHSPRMRGFTSGGMCSQKKELTMASTDPLASGMHSAASAWMRRS